ncbi:MAG: LptF/LptG family permease [Bradyrhizobiaceae bacterium]|nr:LptF/LptG family permease [Bradyrhizobiaceae bacterium]
MILWRYILRAHVGPFVFGTSVIVFLFLSQYMMRYLGDLTSKGLGTDFILEFLALNVAWIVVLAIPIGILFSTLMAFGALSSTSEVTVMKASGMGLIRMMVPVMVVGSLLWAFTFWFTDNVLPDSNHRLSTMMSDIKQLKPTFAVEAGRFSTQVDGFTILARAMDSSGVMHGVTIYDGSRVDRQNIVSADTGKLAFSPSLTKLVIDLYNGEVHQLFPAKPSEYRIIKFAHHQMVMQANRFFLERSDASTTSRGEREMNIADMQVVVHRSDSAVAAIERRIDSLWHRQELPTMYGIGATAIDRQTAILRASALVSTTRAALEGEASKLGSERETANRYRVEIYKKYAIPFACILFVLVGCPLGILTRGGNFGMSAAISLACYVTYWITLIGGEKLADRGLLDPLYAMWMGNVLFLFVGLYATWKVNRR